MEGKVGKLLKVQHPARKGSAAAQVLVKDNSTKQKDALVTLPAVSLSLPPSLRLSLSLSLSLSFSLFLSLYIPLYLSLSPSPSLSLSSLSHRIKQPDVLITLPAVSSLFPLH
jgi:hypothetical protein